MLKYRKYFYILSLTLIILSVVFLMIFGLKVGIDFKGGSLLEVAFQQTETATTTVSLPSHDDVRGELNKLSLGEIVIQNVGERGLLLRFREVDEIVHQNILRALKGFGELEELRFESVGPLIGAETKTKSVWALLLTLAMILLYIAWAFRRISFPVNSWVYGVIALITLFHDVFIAAGMFSIIGHFLNFEIGAPFVAALLTILGYSINDTIVIFDRIRENVLKAGSIFDFGEIIDKSVRETYVRSLNTSLTTLCALTAVYIFGGETTRYFALVLIIGIAVGSYSSIFIASPLLFSWAMLRNKKRG